MKIIVKGPNPKWYRTSCPHCNALFEFTPDEIFRGMATGKKYVDCPNCKRIIYRNFFNWKRVKGEMK